MVIEKPKLFLEHKDFIIFMVIVLFVISLRLFFLHHSYSSFISKPFYYMDTTVLNAYQKSRNNRTYTVLKLRSNNGLTFFTSTNKKENLLRKKLRVEVYPSENISFFDYLGYFYLKSRIKKIYEVPAGTKEALLKSVSNQHQNDSMGSFYNAIFFATPIPNDLREPISGLGISHLVALSGFHLGILWGLIYSILLFAYRPLQKRYFPYRYALFDMGLVTVLLLGTYVWSVDFPPSLVRSYSMVLVGWIVILLGIELLSFTFLTTISLLLILLFPSLIVSLGFWLSVAGVYYIFLILQYTKEVNRWMISMLFIPIGIFLLMLPVVHGIFGMTTPYQILSPLLSLLFILFYPLVMVLHIFGAGNILDFALLWLFGLPDDGVDMLLPLWTVSTYIMVSIVAIWSRKLFYLLLVLAFGLSLYIFYGMTV